MILEQQSSDNVGTRIEYETMSNIVCDNLCCSSCAYSVESVILWEYIVIYI